MKKDSLQWERVTVNIDDLIPADYNPRKMNEKERQDLIDSVKEFGPVVPLVVNTGKRTNVLVGGHQRSQIYKELGFKTVEAYRPHRELSIEEEKRLNLRLNKNTGSWDYDKLKEMDLVVLLDVGFDDDDLQVFFDDVEMFEDGFMNEGKPKQLEKTKSKPGTVWQLGEHRVMCGNSFDEADVQKLMGGATADLLWLDPPLRLDNSLVDVLKGEKTTEGKYAAFLNRVIKNGRAVSSPNAHIFLWSEETNLWLAQTLLQQSGAINRRVMLWIQSDMQVTPKVAFNKAYEACAYATYGKPHVNGNFKGLNEILNKEVMPGNQVQEDIMELFSIWLDKKKKETEYDTGNFKPVTLSERPLKRCTGPGHLVLDMFGGSGSMLIGCQQLKRTCYTMESDPRMVDLIVKRWEELTNKKAKQV